LRYASGETKKQTDIDNDTLIVTLCTRTWGKVKITVSRVLAPTVALTEVKLSVEEMTTVYSSTPNFS